MPRGNRPSMDETFRTSVTSGKPHRKYLSRLSEQAADVVQGSEGATKDKKLTSCGLEGKAPRNMRFSDRECTLYSMFVETTIDSCQGNSGIADDCKHRLLKSSKERTLGEIFGIRTKIFLPNYRRNILCVISWPEVSIRRLANCTNGTAEKAGEET